MKKLLTILVAFVAMIASSFAQAQPESLYEVDFSKGMGEWKSYDLDKKPLHAQPVGILKNAGVKGLAADNTMGWGYIPESYLVASSYFNTPQGQQPVASNDWLISPEIEIKDASIIQVIALNFDRNFRNSIEIYAGEEGDQPENFKKLIVKHTPRPGNFGVYSAYLAENGFENTKIRIAIRHNDLDNFIIALRAVTVIDVPMADRSVNVSAVGYDAPAFLHKNKNLDTLVVGYVSQDYSLVNSLDVVLDIEEIGSKTYTFKDQQIGFAGLVILELPVNKKFSSLGAKKFTMKLTNINGKNEENKSTQTELEGSIFVFDNTNTAKRMSLFEGFTASTCPPCNTVNGIINPYLKKLQDKIAIIKYQTNFPGAGDPYNNVDARARQRYYTISAVPHLALNGVDRAYSNDILGTETAFTKFVMDESSPGLVYIEKPVYSLDKENKQVSITADLRGVAPNVFSEKTFVRVALIEYTTYKNKATNGEKEFHYVCHHLIPDSTGVAFTSTGKEDVQKYEVTFDIPADTHIENMDNLGFVIFVQDDATKSVANAAWIAKKTTSVEADNSGCGIAGIYPNPTTDYVYVKYNVEGTHNVTAELVNAKGAVVANYDFGTSETGTYTNGIDVTTLPAGSYILNVKVGKFTFPNTISVVR